MSLDGIPIEPDDPEATPEAPGDEPEPGKTDVPGQDERADGGDTTDEGGEG